MNNAAKAYYQALFSAIDKNSSLTFDFSE